MTRFLKNDSWNFQILLRTKFVRKWSIIFFTSSLPVLRYSRLCFCFLTIYLNATFKFKVMVDSVLSKWSLHITTSAVTFGCHRTEMKNINCSTFFILFIFCHFFDRDALINAKYEFCLKIKPRILESLGFKVQKRESV